MKTSPKTRPIVLVASVLLVMPVMVCCVWLLKQNGHAPAINQNQIALRFKAQAESRASAQQVLSSYAWQDKDKGAVHLPLERAITLTLVESTNPIAARSNIISRAEVFLAVPPPPPLLTNQNLSPQ